MSPITRRQFIEGTMAAGVTLAAARLPALAAGRPDVVDVHGTNHAKMVDAALAALGGMSRFVKKGDYVVLKPNAGFANPPEWATTTHPNTVVAVAKACVAAGAKRITVVDFPVSKGKDTMARSGIGKALEAIPQVQIKILAGKRDFKKVKIPGGVALPETEVSKLVLSADALINVPAAKQHTEAGVSLGLKNAMGLIYDRRSFHTRLDMSQAIADLGRAIKPDLTIVDATRALLTNGPQGPGETSEPGRMVAGVEIASVDAFALTTARFNQRQMTPDDAPHILLAGKAGLGEVDVAKLNVKKVRV
jgi:uncharacterized protein (DUF362 family)